MDIDKLYRSVGKLVRRAWNQFFSRPVKNFNVENRAFKAIEKKKSAPWHESTKQVIDKIKKESNFEQYNKFDSQLAERLKSVKVVSKDESLGEISDADEEKRKSRLPQDRIAQSMPYVFLKPETVPRGKITVPDAVDLLLNRQRAQMSAKELSEQYQIAEEDVENILKYVDVFKAVDKDKKPLDMKYLNEIIDSFNPESDPNRWANPTDWKKREARMKEQALKKAKEAEEAAAKAVTTVQQQQTAQSESK